MPEAKYSRETLRFDCLGLDLNRPVDSVKPNKFPYVKNCRSFLAGRIEPRDGITNLGQVVAGQSPVHSCRRLNDPSTTFDPNPGSFNFTRVVGAGTHLATGQAFPYTDVDSGPYSGDPLALVPWTPVGAPTAYMYVGDSVRMRKIRVGNTLDTIGYPPPPTAPGVALASPPNYKTVDSGQTAAGWAQSPAQIGYPAVISFNPGAYRTTSTITTILYDVGTQGWASVALTSMVGIGIGEQVIFDATGSASAPFVIQDVFPGSGTTTTIASILFDNGGTDGACAMTFATPIPFIQVDALLNNATHAGNVRITGVISGPDGTLSIRAVTPAASTWAVGDTVSTISSFRIYLPITYTVGQTVRSDGVRMNAAAAGVTTMTKVVALDLSQLAAGVQATPNDYMHLSLRVTSPGQLVEIKAQLDVDATNQDFLHNFYFKAFNPSDITNVVNNTQSVLQSRQTTLQNIILNNPNKPAPANVGSVANVAALNAILAGEIIQNPAVNLSQLPQIFQELNAVNEALSQQLEPGQGQWVELRFRLSDLTRVGTDTTRTLANVDAIQLVVTTIGQTFVDLDSWWIGGGFGPDTGDTAAIPYVYRYRARNPLTNVPSNFSPATRLWMNPLRQSVTVTLPQYSPPTGTSLTTSDLVLDIERFGGQIAEWHYLATIPNTGLLFYVDKIQDLTVGGNPILENTNYQPWPVIGVPVKGTTGIVAGTTIQDIGTNFNISWAMGTRILINNLPFTIYRVISTSLLELVENAGSQTGVPWRIDQPTILAQPLPVLWFDAQQQVFFAAGDPVNPGRLYWSNPSSETTTPANYIDVTSPSEPLMNGLAFNIRSYIFSSENFFQILSTSSFEAIAENSQLATSPVSFEAQKIPNGKGMFSRWGLTREPSPVIGFLAKDGINITTGGSPTAITDADLYELFPNEGNPGVNVNGVGPPNIVASEAANLRLHYYDEYLYFDYRDTNSIRATLLLAFDLGAAVRGEAPGGWFFDIYGNSSGIGVFHYGEEGAGIHDLLIGGSNGNLYQYSGFSDDGASFPMEFTTPSKDQGEPRANKLYGDVMMDSQTNGVTALVTPFFNNNAISAPVISVNTPTRTQNAIPLGASWQTAKNISIFVHCDVSTSARPFFYIWEPRWTFESAPISAFSWEISPTTFGMEGFKHFGLCKVTHVSTAPISLVFTVDGVVQPTIFIPASGGIYQETIFRVPVMKGKLFKLAVSSATEWRIDSRDSFFEVKQWGADDAYNKLRIFSDFADIRG